MIRQEEVRTPAIDLNSIMKGRKTTRIEEEDICIKVENLNLFYGAKQALHGVDMLIPRKKSHGLYRTQRVRQIDAVTLH